MGQNYQEENKSVVPKCPCILPCPRDVTFTRRTPCPSISIRKLLFILENPAWVAAAPGSLCCLCSWQPSLLQGPPRQEAVAPLGPPSVRLSSEQAPQPVTREGGMVGPAHAHCTPQNGPGLSEPPMSPCCGAVLWGQWGLCAWHLKPRAAPGMGRAFVSCSLQG